MKGHITIVEQIVHYVEQQQPQGEQFAFARACDTDEQIYVRRYSINDEWQNIDVGWMGAHPGMVHIEHEIKHPDKNPTAEEKAELALPILVGISDGGVVPVLKIRPGETARFEPCDLAGMFIRSIKGERKIVLRLYPQ